MGVKLRSVTGMRAETGHGCVLCRVTKRRF
jgi:hypothetical protein